MSILIEKGQGRAGLERAGQGRAGQGRTGQGRTGQDRAGQGRAHHLTTPSTQVLIWLGSLDNRIEKNTSLLFFAILKMFLVLFIFTLKHLLLSILIIMHNLNSRGYKEY